MFIVFFGMKNHNLADRGNMAVESDLPDPEGSNIDNAVGTADRRFGLLHSRDDEIRCMRKEEALTAQCGSVCAGRVGRDADRKGNFIIVQTIIPVTDTSARCYFA
ncbi:hypothetical protein [Klebsiella oxytoca]|uniref:hypothetical protein n=1 Tax=Klebsiella oxytoca TaxID=571 RepID=UPI00224736D6|nr:hypothetical protein [Klebsiella oxytoca]MCW9445994.1 hypothetical protein [Klebsiella oxytoca]